MTIRVAALLRGINVGKQKQVDMAGLRKLLTSLGYVDVQTHLRSGNAVFGCEAAAIPGVAGTIEDRIAGELGIDCRVVIRTGEEFDLAMRSDPLAATSPNPSRHFVGFLSTAPDPDRAALLPASSAGSELRVVGSHLYLWCPDGLSASPLGKLNFDRLLDVVVTLRNWNTVAKVAEMLGVA